jgi:hypothetical protein
MSLVLTPAEQTEAVANLAAVRELGIQMIDVFAGDAPEARAGAERLAASVDRVIELLGSPLTPAEQAEAIGNLEAVRQLGTEMADVLSNGSSDAREGADRMVAAVDRVLGLLGATTAADP